MSANAGDGTRQPAASVRHDAIFNTLLGDQGAKDSAYAMIAAEQASALATPTLRHSESDVHSSAAVRHAYVVSAGVVQ
jgi:hypothetical protein